MLLADGMDEVGRSVAGPSGASRDRLAFGGGLEYSRRRAVDRVLLPPNKPEAAPRTLRKRGRHGSSRLTLTRLPPPRPALQQLASRGQLGKRIPLTTVCAVRSMSALGWRLLTSTRRSTL